MKYHFIILLVLIVGCNLNKNKLTKNNPKNLRYIVSQVDKDKTQFIVYEDNTNYLYLFIKNKNISNEFNLKCTETTKKIFVNSINYHLSALNFKPLKI